ncbi:DUF6-domain-containing protein [Backusella circina FSU 941]|nr:DUF6-domain-containing protein [Backusella circina FSU 941]
MSTSHPREDPPAHPIPSSVIIANESTPLLSHDINTTPSSFSLHSSSAHVITPPSSFALSSDVKMRHNELKGLFIMVVSSLLFTLVSVLVKQLGEQYPSSEIVFARSSIQLVLGLISCLFLGINPLGKRGVRRWLLFRGFVTSGGLFLFFYSLTKLPILDATVIFFLGPIFTLMVASVFLNEHFSTKEGFFSVLCFLGVLLISKPSFLFQNPTASQKTELGRFFAIACALGGAIMSAMAYISVKKVGQGTHVLVHVVYFGLVASIASPIVIILSNREFIMPGFSNWDDLCKLSFVGLFSFIGQPLLNEGLKLAPRGPATLMRTIDVVFAYVLGIGLFNEIPSFSTMVGSIIIICVTTSLGLGKWRREYKQAALRKQRSRERLINQSK